MKNSPRKGSSWHYYFTIANENDRGAWSIMQKRKKNPLNKDSNPPNMLLHSHVKMGVNGVRLGSKNVQFFFF